VFTESTIRDVRIGEEAVYVSALVHKLIDLDKSRIHASDDLILRKAVFGLLEVVAALEQRLADLEGPEAQEAWSARLSKSLDALSPDQARLGE
jgi:hypothetical protein